MNVSLLLTCMFLLLARCGPKSGASESDQIIYPPSSTLGQVSEDGDTLVRRFSPPRGYVRTTVADNSFAAYLRDLPLYPAEALVHYYNGKTKLNRNIYAAVVDLPIGKRDLHQCADAVIRLRSDYLYDQRRFGDIQFHLTNGDLIPYQRWREGERPKVTSDNQVIWKHGGASSESASSYWKYLEFIFSYAGTASLSKELKSLLISDMNIGDVLIQGGHPGHAVIVVDMAASESGEKLYMLAQSYMPAQEIQILQNPTNSKLSPWYKLTEGEQILTPEWRFYSEDLKRF